jgi:hypothetical protein
MVSPIAIRPQNPAQAPLTAGAGIACCRCLGTPAENQIGGSSGKELLHALPMLRL